MMARGEVKRLGFDQSSLKAFNILHTEIVLAYVLSPAAIPGACVKRS